MKFNSSVLLVLTYALVGLVGVVPADANSFRRDKTNTSSNPGWPMNVEASQWPPGVPRTQANADSIIAHHQQLIAARYSWTTNGDPRFIDGVKALKPDFGWFQYNSFQDNYVPGEEHDWLVARCQERGINPERLYLHYWDATTMNLQGQLLSFPGLANARSRTDSINSRVPVYYSARNRLVPNYSDPAVRQLIKEYACHMVTRLETQGSYIARDYIDGIFWDNTQTAFWNEGARVSGGHIAEAPGRTRIDSIGSSGTNWWWSGNILPFFSALRDTFETSALWTRDRQKKRYDINTSGIMYEPMAMNSIADFFGQEGSYSTLRTYTGSIPQIYSWDSLCAVNGVGIVYAPTLYTSISGYAGSYTYHEAMYNNLCLFYVTSSDSAFFSPLGAPGADEFNWDSLVWCGAMDHDIGPHHLADRKYSILTTGVDPKGYNFTIYQRNYPRAKVVLRTRGNSSQDIDATTTVTINLGGSYREVRPDGTLGPVTTTVTLRNGQGKVMAAASSGGDAVPPAAIRDLSSEAGPDNGTVELTWTAPGDDEASGTASYYDIKFSRNPLSVASWDAAASFGRPPAPKSGGSPEQFVLTGLEPGLRYYLGVRAVDELGNTGGLSNEAISFARGIATPIRDTVIVIGSTHEVILRVLPITSYIEFRLVFQIDTSSAFQYPSSLSDSTPATSFVSIPGLTEHVRYYWRCRAEATDGSSQSAWSSVNSFRPSWETATGDEETNASVRALPRGEIFRTRKPTLTVSIPTPVGGGEFVFEVATDTIFTTMAVESPPIPAELDGTTSWQVSESLSPSVIYYWRVNVAFEQYTGTGSFTIEGRPHVFPNPAKLSEASRIVFTEVPVGSSLAILTSSGETVRRWTDLAGSELTWDGTNTAGNKVASGTYLWFIENSPARGKLIVIR